MYENPLQPSILVVEDDESMRELLSLHLRNAGYRVTVAEDAVVAGRAVLTCAFDLVVADIDLPYMNGVEFAALLTADTSLPSVPIILISAHEHYRERAEAMELTFLPKPIHKDELLETVARVLSATGGLEQKTRPASAASISGFHLEETARQATLRRARDLAGGVSFLGRQLGVGVNALDAMLWGTEEVPTGVFLKAAEFIAGAEEAGSVPPGFPANWESAESSSTA